MKKGSSSRIKKTLGIVVIAKSFTRSLFLGNEIASFTVRLISFSPSYLSSTPSYLSTTTSLKIHNNLNRLRCQNNNNSKISNNSPTGKIIEDKSLSKRNLSAFQIL